MFKDKDNQCVDSVPQGRTVSISHLHIVKDENGKNHRVIYFWGFLRNAQGRVINIATVRIGTCYEDGISWTDKDISDPEINSLESLIQQANRNLRLGLDTLESGEATRSLVRALDAESVEVGLGGRSIKINPTKDENCDSDCNRWEARYVDCTGKLKGRLLNGDSEVISGSRNTVRIVDIVQ